jgi:death on curing protein
VIVYIDLEDALSLVNRLGFFVKDVGLLDSALARPQATVFGEDAYPTLALKAAAMAHSLIKNHSLVDGNKRTTWALLVSFLFVNGYKHDFTSDEGYAWTIGLATDELDLQEAARQIESHMVRLD